MDSRPGSLAIWRLLAAALVAALLVWTSLPGAPSLPSFAAPAPRPMGQALVAFVKNIGTAANKTSGTSISVAVPVAGVAAGNSIIVTLAMDPSAGAVSCADSASNTYTVDADVTNGSAANGVRTVICAAHNVAALSSGQTITVTHPTATAKAVAADDFSGLTTTPLDKTSSATGNSTSPSSGTTTLTSQADELLIGAIGMEGPTTDSFTEGTNYTPLTRSGTTGTPPGGNTPTSTATKTSTPTATRTPDAVKCVDDADARWQYFGIWSVVNNSLAFQGGVHRSNQGGAIARVTFTKTAPSIVSILSIRGPNEGIMRVFMDGTLVGDFDLFNPTLLWQQVAASVAVGAGSHTLEVRVTGNKNPSSMNSYVSVDAECNDLVGPSPTPAGTPTKTPTPAPPVGCVGAPEAEDSSVIKAGAWDIVSGTTFSGGRAVSSRQANDKLQVTLAGSVIQVCYSKLPNGGFFEVRIDGNLAGTVNTFNPVRLDQQVATFGTAGGSHLVEVRNTGGVPTGSLGSWTIIDAFRGSGAVAQARGEQVAEPYSRLSAAPSEGGRGSWSLVWVTEVFSRLLGILLGATMDSASPSNLTLTTNGVAASGNVTGNPTCNVSNAENLRLGATGDIRNVLTGDEGEIAAYNRLLSAREIALPNQYACRWRVSV